MLLINAYFNSKNIEFAYTLVSSCRLLASSLCRVQAWFCLWFRFHAGHRSCGRPTVPRCVFRAAPAVIFSTVIKGNEKGKATCCARERVNKKRTILNGNHTFKVSGLLVKTI